MVTYFDGLWRPLLVREYDAADPTGTQRFTRTAYDLDGRVAFQSYPASNSTSTTGTWTEYDALGRVTSVAQDSEQGLLV
ncbi:MAG: type IV secretion protein Rhs, partial [Thermomonas haemolytica]